MSSLTVAPIDRDLLRAHAAEFRNSGTVLFPPFVVFSQEDLDRLESAQALLPEERVVIGDVNDKHDLFVRRIMVDKPGENPSVVNQPFSDPIVSLISDEVRTHTMGAVLDTGVPYYIRRCQVNRLVEGSFVGIHLDAESNPDYEFSVIIQLGREFQGGDFVVYPEGRPAQAFTPVYGSVVVTTCHFRHEVTRVTSGERNAIVYFYSRNAGINPRPSST